MNKNILLFSFVLLGSCTRDTIIHEQKNTSTYKDKCYIAELNSGNNAIGTIFKTRTPEGVIYLTASHSLPSIINDNLYLTTYCTNKKIRHKIVAFENLPNTDVSLLKPDSKIDELLTLEPLESEYSGEVFIPNYSSLANFDPILSNVILTSRGDLLKKIDGNIYFTANSLFEGASGAPILTKQGDLLGLVNGRYNLNNNKDIYSGVGYGTSIEKILKAIKSTHNISVDSINMRVQQQPRSTNRNKYQPNLTKR